MSQPLDFSQGAASIEVMANASLAPVLLVSMPQMLDPNFSKTVVLLAEYGAHGAFGLVVNRRMDEPAMSIVTADDPLDIHPKMHLYTGGPVEPTRAWILTAQDRSRSRGARGDEGRLPVGVADARAQDARVRARSRRAHGGGLCRAGARGSSTSSSRKARGCWRRCSPT